MPTATPLIRAAFSFVGEFAGMFRRRQSGEKKFARFRRRVFGRQLDERHTIRVYRLA
jgi:hypothetical protein